MAETFAQKFQGLIHMCNNSYAQQHSSEKQQAAAPAQPGQAPSYGSGVIKPPTSDTEIPPWIRG